MLLYLLDNFDRQRSLTGLAHVRAEPLHDRAHALRTALGFSLLAGKRLSHGHQRMKCHGCKSHARELEQSPPSEHCIGFVSWQVVLYLMFHITYSPAAALLLALTKRKGLSQCHAIDLFLRGCNHNGSDTISDHVHQGPKCTEKTIDAQDQSHARNRNGGYNDQRTYKCDEARTLHSTGPFGRQNGDREQRQLLTEGDRRGRRL